MEQISGPSLSIDRNRLSQEHTLSLFDRPGGHPSPVTAPLTYLMHSHACLQLSFVPHLIYRLVISPIGLDSILTSSHGSVLFSLLCLLSFVGTGTLSVSVCRVNITVQVNELRDVRATVSSWSSLLGGPVGAA